MPKYTDNFLSKKEPYKSIMNVFFIYGYQKSRLIGIEHKHLLYVFKPSRKELKTEEINNFFKHFSGNTLEDFSDVKDNKVIFRRKKSGEDAIRDAGDLNKCLTLLRNRGWIKERGKPNHYVYYLSSEFFAQNIIRRIKNQLDIWKSEVIVDFTFDTKMKEQGFDNKPVLWEKKSAWSLFGFEPPFIDCITKEEKEKLNNNIKNITKNLEEINNLKLRHINKKTLINALRENNVELLFRLYNINFFYLGTPLYNKQTIEEEKKKILKE